MAIRRKSSRKIVVGARTYRWHYLFDNDPSYDVQVIVYAEGSPHEAQLRAKHAADSVTPSLVRRIIETGLTSAWDPDGSSSYILSSTETRDAFQGFPRSPTIIGGQDDISA